MDILIILLIILLLVMAGALGIWWRDGRSFGPFREKLRCGVRQSLRASSQEEMRRLENHLEQREVEVETRLASLEAATQFASQHLLFSKDIDRRLIKLETVDPVLEPSPNRRFPRPRAIVRHGLRFTLNDRIWECLGSTVLEEVEPKYMATMIQGPFCVKCLKRLVGRDQVLPSDPIPLQCRHCGIQWMGKDAQDSSPSLMELKQRIYKELYHEYQSLGKIQPFVC